MSRAMRTPAALLIAGLASGAAAQTPPLQPSPRETAPMIPVAPTVRDLLGKDGREVTRLLGPPRIAHAQGDGAMWTYQRPICALHVFFRRDSGSDPLRVSGVSSGPLQPGAAAPDVERCLAYGAVL